MGIRRQCAFGIIIVGAALIATLEASPTPVDLRDVEIRQLMKSLLLYLRERMQNPKMPHDLFVHTPKPGRPTATAEDIPAPDFEDPDRMDFHDSDKRQFDDYGHMRFGKRGPHFDDYGHMRFGRSAGVRTAADDKAESPAKNRLE